MTLRVKLTLAIIAFGATVMCALSIGLFVTTRAQMRDDFRQRLSDIAGVGALSVDGELHRTLTEPEQEGDAEYLQIRRVLQQIRNTSTDIHFVYTMRVAEDGRILFVVDAETDPEEIAHLGSEYTEASPLLRRNAATLSTSMSEEDFYTDRWGTWLTGYAPIFGDDGERVGLLGVDIKAARIQAYERKLVGVFTAIFLVGLVVSVLLGTVLGNRLAAPIVALTRRAERVGQGDLETSIPVSSNDELGVLEAAFNNMTRQLRELVEQLRAEVASREEAERKYRSIFDNALEGIFQSSHDGRFLTCNPELARMLGYERAEDVLEQVTHIPTQLYVDHSDRDAVLDKLDRDGSVAGLRTRMRRQDGSIIWTELSARRVLDESTGQQYIEGLLKDITQQLEKEVAEQNERVAQEASRAKSEFLANMSHEIRTPMNAVIGLAHLTLKTELTPRQRDYVQKILRSAKALLRIINDILDFSKIEAGKLTMESVPFDIEQVLHSLAGVMSLTADEKGLELLFNLDPKVPRRLIGDPLRLEQVLTNLVANALKFTERGSVVVAIGHEPESEGASEEADAVRLRFSVSDTGIGLSKHAAARLFESFSQADASVTRRHGGTGLGLSICKRLVEMMGGQIWVESTLGEGSTFSFTGVFSRAFEADESRFRYPPQLDGLRVLVVDDNSAARDILCDMLASFSFTADPVASGEEAVAALEAAVEDGRPYQLVLMDWRMPGMDGVETSAAIHDHPNLAEVPSILMVTAYSRDEVQERAQAAGVSGFLIKPVNPSLLFDAIVSLFASEDNQQLRLDESHDLNVQGLDDIRGARLLLVEDNPINQQVARELLEAEGFKVDTADHGRAALEQLAATDGPTGYDLVLMDIQMPEMDGVEAARRIRSLEGAPGQTPIVAMTAHALEAERERCLAAGMNDHVPKPIDPAQLFSTLVRWIPAGAGGAAPRCERPTGSPAPQPPLALRVVDGATGLARVAGNRALYIQLLEQFADKHAASADSIHALIASGRTADAAAQAHAIKGMAGNLGAMELADGAARIEDLLNAGDHAGAESSVTDYASKLGAVLDDIWSLTQEPFPAAPVSTQDAPVVNPKLVLAMLYDLRQKLQTDYGAALATCTQLTELLSESAEARTATEIQAHLEGFDEESAAAATECLIQRLNQTDEET